MAGTGSLNPANIRSLLDELDRELGHGRDRVEMYVAGGARMILGLRDDRSTGDIDGLIRQGHGRLIKAAKQVSLRHADLDPNWLNEEMSLAIPRKEDTGEVTLYTGNRLTIRGVKTPHARHEALRAPRSRHRGRVRHRRRDEYQGDGIRTENRGGSVLPRGQRNTPTSAPPNTRRAGTARDGTTRPREEPQTAPLDSLNRRDLYS